MAYRQSTIQVVHTNVICDKCGAEKLIARTAEPLGFDNRMNATLLIGYTFKAEKGMYMNYCVECKTNMEKKKEEKA